MKIQKRFKKYEEKTKQKITRLRKGTQNTK